MTKSLWKITFLGRKVPAAFDPDQEVTLPQYHDERGIRWERRHVTKTTRFLRKADAEPGQIEYYQNHRDFKVEAVTESQREAWLEAHPRPKPVVKRLTGQKDPYADDAPPDDSEEPESDGDDGDDEPPKPSKKTTKKGKGKKSKKKD